MNRNNCCISNLDTHLHMNLVKICCYVLYKLHRGVKFNLSYAIKRDFLLQDSALLWKCAGSETPRVCVRV